MKKRKLLPILLALAMVLTMIPAAVFATNGTVDNVTTFRFIGGATTQKDIDNALGEGAVSYTSEEIGGETVYTIKLLKDINMAPGCDVRIGEYRENGPELPQMILDLNGCTITSQSIGLINYGDLIIRDTSDSKKGGITYSTTSDKSSLVAISHKGGLLVIEDGTFTCESGYAFTGYVAAVSTQAGAVTHIKGGTFISNSSAVLSAGETIVYGGYFEAPYGMYAKSADGVPGTITVPEDSTAVVDASSFAFVIQRDGETDGKISVAGGTYNAPKVVGGVRQPDTAEAVSITGGVYEEDPSTWVSGDIAVASLTSVGEENTPIYAVGGNDISKLASDAETGDIIDILSGSIELTGIADGVVIKNSGTDNVTVNGETVTGENPVIVCNHTWGDPVWKWETDNSAAAASFTCEKDQTHTETVNAVITKAVTTPATCTNEGITTYTATVEFNGKTYTDVKPLSNIAKIAHTYKNGKCIVCGAADPDYKPDSSAQTGDDFNMAIPFAAAGIALAALAAVVATRKRHN